MSGPYRIWYDVIKLVNKLTDEYYTKKKSKTYLRKHAMKEAYKDKKYEEARAEYQNFKKNHPAEWKRLQDEYTAAKKKKSKK